jgi:TonB family protein
MSIYLKTLILGAGVCLLPIVSSCNAQGGAPAVDAVGAIAPPAPNPASLCDDLYPSDERSSGSDGITILSVHIQPDGTMTNASVLSSSGETDFDAAAVQCARRAKSPQKSGGGPIEVDWVATVDWRHRGHSFIEVPGLKPCRATHYPMSAVRNGEQGVVAFAWQIGLDGRPTNVKILKSSGHDDLDAAAVTCTKDWRFPPATQNGKPVAIDKTFMIAFGLRP